MGLGAGMGWVLRLGLGWGGSWGRDGVGLEAGAGMGWVLRLGQGWGGSCG